MHVKTVGVDGRRWRQGAMAAAMLAAMVLASGCRVENETHGDGGNVKIATPFGGMSVKTNDTTVVDGLGMPVYPGAELVKKKDKNEGAADVNLSFGGFQIRVKAAEYRTPDSTDKVKEFYRKALARYGQVIECQDNKAVGTPVKTAEGLTCDNDKENHISVDKNVSGKFELKAGSKQHQHIVGIDTEGSETKIGMVALDLPGRVSFGDDAKSGDDQKQ